MVEYIGEFPRQQSEIVYIFLRYDLDGLDLYLLLDKVQPKSKSSVKMSERMSEYLTTYTFLEYAWFHMHGCEVQVSVAKPRRMKASTLKRIAATCEHTSTSLYKRHIK